MKEAATPSSPHRTPRTTAPMAARAARVEHPARRGHHAVPAVLRHPLIQTRLTVSRPDDVYEQEADRIADQVLCMADPVLAQPGIDRPPIRPQSIQRLCKECEAEDELQRQPQDRASDSESPGLEAVTTTLGQAGRPLDSPTRAFFEPRFGVDFSSVRLHTNSQAAESARAVNALAYTVGAHVVFNSGQYAPHRDTGRRLLAHELTHVIQQTQPRAWLEPSPDAKPLPARSDRARLSRLPAPGTGPMLQRQRRGSAGGCGICLGGHSGIAGSIAHIEVQSAFLAANPDIVAERIVPTVTDEEEAPFSPQLDLSYESFEHGQKLIYIGEIKPLDDAGQQRARGRRQLQDYARELSFSYDEVYRMRDAPPSGPLFFPNPKLPAGCPPQLIQVQLTEPGLYQYFCDPPFSELVRNPLCRCHGFDEKDDPVPIAVRRPERVRVPETRARPPQMPQAEGDRQPTPVPRPTGEPTQEPVSEPTPDRVPDDDKVIPFPGRPSPAPVPDSTPEELPVAARSSWQARLITIGVPAALVTAVIGVTLFALVDPEPVSKLASALAAILGIGGIAATAMALLILRAVKSGDGPEA